MQRGIPPRALHPAVVQDRLVTVGCRLAAQTYADVPRSHPRWADVQLVAGRTLMNGVGETTFAPDDPLTRAQAAAVVARAFDVPVGALPPAPTFQDMPPDHWAYPYVEALVAAGLTSGCSANPPLFCPDAPLVRAAAAKFLASGMGYGPEDAPASPAWADVPGGHWALPWVQLATSLGILAPCGPGLFCPDASLSRAEAAAALRKVVLLMVDG